MTERSELRPGLWQTVNDRYPGSMITNSGTVPLARPEKPFRATDRLYKLGRRAAPGHDAL